MNSLTLIIPAFNEEASLEGSIEDVLPFLEKLESYEIFIFDDCSRDKTAEIADALARNNHKIKVVHNSSNKGLGYNYKKGVSMANMDYVLMIPADRDMRIETYEQLFPKMGQADIVLAYTGNMQVRPLTRRIVSYSFTWLMNTLFGMRLRYFNGIVLHKCSILKTITIETDGFAYQAEGLIKLIKRGHSYLETPQWVWERKTGSSKAFAPKNVVRVIKTIFKLFYHIQICGKK